MSQAILIELQDIAPELDFTDTEAIDRWIGRAQRYVNADIVGDDYSTLVAYKCAELMTKARPSEAVSSGQGELLEETVDNAKYKYGSTAGAKADREKEFRDEFESRMANFIYIEEGPV